MSLARSFSLFTLVPVRTKPELAAGDGTRALLWLPVVGALIGGISALPLLAIRHWSGHATLVGAVLAVALLAGLTRGLHLDGLADTADGLGSRAPAERALQIMRQSDIGPFGVSTLALVLLVDIAALTVMRGSDWLPVAALATAAATGRVTAVAAARRGVTAARSSGFGTLVADGIAPAAVLGWVVGVLLLGAVLALGVGGSAAWFVVAQVVALAEAEVFRRHVQRRIGGITGDVFGALIELSTAVVLIGICLR